LNSRAETVIEHDHKNEDEDDEDENDDEVGCNA